MRRRAGSRPDDQGFTRTVNPIAGFLSHPLGFFSELHAKGAGVDFGDYRYRGQVVRCVSLVVNSTIVHRSSCWLTSGAGTRERITGNSKAEIEAKIDALMGSRDRVPALILQGA